MLVRKFMLWVSQVSAAERAEGAGALARAYLYSDLDETEQREAEVALFSLLDDPSPIVRKSIAEAFASGVDAPHAIVLALANDQSAISSIVLGRSPILSDAELIDAFLRRERSAADELYRRFAPRVFGLGMVMLGNAGQAEDLV